MFTIKKFTPRLYQEKILNSITQNNTLVCLPTGRGKTKIGLLIALHRLNQYPESKIFFLTPTKPLASQIRKEFLECSNLEKVVLFTGEVNPMKREELFKDAQVIISTPQGLSNDIINNRISLKNVSCIIFDEAHRAQGNYDYVWIAKKYQELSIYPKIVALTASPGSNKETIEAVGKNLFIEKIEIRTDKDEDLQPYVKETKTIYQEIELPKEFLDTIKTLEICFKSRLNTLKNFGLLNKQKIIGKGQLLKLQRELQIRISKGERTPEIWKIVAKTAELIKIGHAQELLETQGVHVASEYFTKIYSEAESGKTKSSKNLALDLNFKSAQILIQTLKEHDVKHPKIEALKTLITKELAPGKKILVFTNYRDTAKRLRDQVKCLPNVRPEVFVGQTKKKGLGLTQKEQLQRLEDFKVGKYNVLFCTSVGEEGIDIPSVDLIVFYEPVPSGIRSVQRRGRTGRMQDGKVVVLIAKGTRDEAYRWSAHHKEKRMHKILRESNKEVVKNATLESFVRNGVKIIADHRESGSQILKILMDKGVDLTTKQLEVADFVLSAKVGVERKEVKDFVDSIIDKRIMEQALNLKNNFEAPVIIIEGEENIYSVRKVHPNAIRGMLSWIAVDLKIPVIYTKNTEDTAEFLITIAKREQNEIRKEFGVRGEKKPLTSKELQEFIVAGLPGVGPNLAKNLLKKFNTVANIINASVDQLKTIEKIGDKKARKIKEILNKKY
jgi:ERCC4-related helicase